MVELAAADLIAGSSVQDALDVQTGNAEFGGELRGMVLRELLQAVSTLP